MNPISFSVSDTSIYNGIEFVIVTTRIEGNICDPEDLKTLKFPEIPQGVGVALNGRQPMWLMGTLVHHFHPTPFIALFDPNQKGAVVVQTHKKGVAVGDVIPLPKSE